MPTYVTIPSNSADKTPDTSPVAVIATTVTAPGGTPTQVVGVQSATDWQRTSAPSSAAIQTANGVVFTLAAGKVGYIENLSTIPLNVNLGGTASATLLHAVLSGASVAGNGTGGRWLIDNYVGPVSVFSQTGTGSYLAWSF